MVNSLRIFFVVLSFLAVIRSQSFNEKWITEFEKSNYQSTATYEQTVKYFNQFAEYPEVKIEKFGVSPQGRDLICLIISKDGLHKPADVKKNRKPVVFIENAIHSGEIEGKDACMLLLREILVTKEKYYYLKNLALIIVPIFSVDGHERSSPYNRINQNGPTNMGWRTTAQNLNLNRDFMKADAPEMKALLRLFNKWEPDLFIDTHTTNGADYQYDLTYIMHSLHDVTPSFSQWVKNKYIPRFKEDLQKEGFKVYRYIYPFRKELKEGIIDFISPPRLATGYGAAQNTPTITVETHMLKPYKRRVFATKALIESSLKMINENPEELLKVNEKTDKERIELYYKTGKYFPVRYKLDSSFTLINFEGKTYDYIYSDVAGAKIIKYFDRDSTFQIPFYGNILITDSVKVPEGYLIPGEWIDIIDVIKNHGIKLTEVTTPSGYNVERYEFKDVTFAEAPYEGRFIPEFEYTVKRETILIDSGYYFVNTNQRRLSVIVQLLEPKAEDSFLRWGFFNAIFERKEYFEDYSMEPIAKKMFEENSELRKEFNEKLKSDEEFKNNPRARLNFFYKRSPYYDEKHNQYPVLRVIDKIK
ncbi:MAG: M14 family metallopeptidase [Ignavibacteria bacterium]|jgi:hypothetical protein